MWVLTRTAKPELVNLDAFRLVYLVPESDGKCNLVATDNPSFRSNATPADSTLLSRIIGEYDSEEAAREALKFIARYLREEDQLADLVGLTTGGPIGI